MKGSCMDKQIPITVINLKKDTDRKDSITQQLNGLNLEFSFFEGVYGKELSPKELTAVYNPEHSIEKGVGVLSKGEIGATLSHFGIYQKMLDDDIDEMIIFEDDTIIGQDFVQALDIVKHLPENWEIFLLGYSSGRKKPCNFNINLKNNPTPYSVGVSPIIRGGAFCYVINKRGAQRMLSYKKSLYKVIDIYTGDSNMINVYTISPRVAALGDDFESSVEDREPFFIPKWKRQKVIKVIRDFNNNRRKKRKEKDRFSTSCILRKIKYRVKHGFKEFYD